MKKVLIIISSIFLLMIVLLLFFINKPFNRNYKIINFEYEEEFIIDDNIDNIDNNEILLQNYNDYKKIVDKYNLYYHSDSDDYYLKEDDFNLYNYLLIFYQNNCGSENEVVSLKYDEDKNILLIDSKYHEVCGNCLEHYSAYLYRIDKIDKKDIILKHKYHKGNIEHCDPDVSYKPILYLYPEQNMYVNIKLDNYNNIITSYPKYNNGWNVFVTKDGIIHYNDREYYALYWDEYNNNEVDFNTGFYVNSENAINFLEEKLDIIGLNNREANEFIMYWLPILEKNKNSLVYFELTEERENSNKLEIFPKPDSILRINMHIMKIYDKIDIEEEKLETFKRKGFTAIEWGGTIHKEEIYAR